jgi:hypothetical protein
VLVLLVFLAGDAVIQSAFLQARVVQVVYHEFNVLAFEVAEWAVTAFVVVGAIIPHLL